MHASSSKASSPDRGSVSPSPVITSFLLRATKANAVRKASCRVEKDCILTTRPNLHEFGLRNSLASTNAPAVRFTRNSRSASVKLHGGRRVGDCFNRDLCPIPDPLPGLVGTYPGNEMRYHGNRKGVLDIVGTRGGSIPATQRTAAPAVTFVLVFLLLPSSSDRPQLVCYRLRPEVYVNLSHFQRTNHASSYYFVSYLSEF